MPGFLRWLQVGQKRIPQVSSTITSRDRMGSWKARWGINRMNYMVPAGLYAIGEPTPESPVLVTSNYKMSYDLVRRALAGRNVWLLVLETFGINVWCAAGKGTFGTDELVGRIARSGLAKVVSHRRLTLPVLGAAGVAAHEVKRRTGFSVRYAAVRAGDLPEYLDNGEVTTSAMRELSFNWYDRLILIPVEIVLVLKPLAIAGGIIYLAGAMFGGEGVALKAVLAFAGAVLTGLALAPLCLPLLPARSFALKGTFAGAIFSALFFAVAGGSSWPLPVAAALFLAAPAVSAFYTLNFTGCTTYTSRSGVKKEMRIGLPVMGSALALALVLLLAAKFI